MLTRLSTIAPQNAETKLSTRNAGDKIHEATSSIRALITNQNRPSVRIVRGKVKILRTTPNVALTRPMTKAVMSAAGTLLTWNPEIRCELEIIQTASALNSQLIRCRRLIPRRKHSDCVNALQCQII